MYLSNTITHTHITEHFLLYLLFPNLILSGVSAYLENHRQVWFWLLFKLWIQGERETNIWMWRGIYWRLQTTFWRPGELEWCTSKSKITYVVCLFFIDRNCLVRLYMLEMVLWSLLRLIVLLNRQFSSIILGGSRLSLRSNSSSHLAGCSTASSLKYFLSEKRIGCHMKTHIWGRLFTWITLKKFETDLKQYQKSYKNQC